MKKVGVITMHRLTNYGSVLQAYATQKMLERLGCRCEIIDYVYPNEYQFSRGYKHHPLTWKSRIAKALWLKPYWRKRNRLERFARRYINLSSTYHNRESLRCDTPQYDMYMTGSDQVWNPFHMKGDGTFLLDFAPQGAYKIAFSASFACDELPKEYKQYYATFLGQYKAISVREENGQRLISNLLGVNVPVTLDPTLMLDTNSWKELTGNKHNRFDRRKYILFYMLSYAFNPCPYIYKLLKHLQEETGYEVYSFSRIPKEFHCKHVSYFDDASPIKFLQLFTHAACVVTSSFHGTAFAVNFGVPVYSVVNNDCDGRDDRQISLLRHLQLKDCIIKKGTPLECIHYKPNMPDSFCEKLAELRKDSERYLQKELYL